MTVWPLASQPGHAPYSARGVWKFDHLDIALEDGAVLTSGKITMGIRFAEFAVVPIKGDKVRVDGIDYVIDDVTEDGEGGGQLVLKKRIEQE